MTSSSQSGTRSRIATWYKDAAVNSTDDPPFPPSFALRVSRKKTEQEIDNLRRVLVLARKETHGAFQKFTQAWDAERKAQGALAAAEDRRGELSEPIVAFFRFPPHFRQSILLWNIRPHIIICSHVSPLLFIFCSPSPWRTGTETFKTLPLHPSTGHRCILMHGSPLSSLQRYLPTRHSPAPRLLPPIVSR